MTSVEGLMLATDAGSLVARDCRSNQGKAPAPARGGGQRKTAQARVFALTPGDAEASNDVVTGTLPFSTICSILEPPTLLYRMYMLGSVRRKRSRWTMIWQWRLRWESR